MNEMMRTTSSSQTAARTSSSSTAIATFYAQCSMFLICTLLLILSSRTVLVVGSSGNAGAYSALASLYLSTNGESWTTSTHWLETSVSYCDWFGIECQSASESIVAIRLRGNNLVGSIPATGFFSALGSSLEALDLSANALIGKIPDQIGSCKALKEVILNSNQLSGILPVAIGSLESLEVLQLGNKTDDVIKWDCSTQSECPENYLEGNIPAEICNLQSVRVLKLGQNSFSGQIPDCISRLQKLEILDLSLNGFLTGPLPSSLYALPSLLTLSLAGNAFTGTLTENISQLRSLRILSIYSTQISGPLPSTIGNLSALTWLDLESNDFHSQIPDSIGQLSQLQCLDLDSNRLNGSLPESIGRLEQLKYLILHSNQLSGPIPLSIGNLSQLREVSLYSNQLSGTIPSSIGNLSQLTKFYLDSNQLSGSIPSSIGHLSQLTYLDFSYNRLSGSIADSFWQLQNLQTVSLDNNELSGSVLATSYNLTRLQFLNLESNRFTGEIPSSLGLSIDLSYLNLCNNSFSGEIPTSLGNLRNLAILRLCENRLSGSIPASLGNLGNLESLKLFSNQLTGSLPESFGLLQSLNAFYVYSNSLTGELHPSLGGLSALVDLRISDNYLSGPLPNTLANLTNLLYLDISNNSFSAGLSDTVKGLRSLYYLNISHNQFNGSVPTSIFAPCIKNLTVLDFSNNMFENLTIPESPTPCANLQTIAGSHNQIKFVSLPADLQHWEALTSLDLSYNSIVDITELGAKLLARDLKMKYNPGPNAGSDNMYAHVALIQNMPLSSLRLDHNRIDSLPPSFFQFRATNLYFGNNALRELPATVETSYKTANYYELTYPVFLDSVVSHTMIDLSGNLLRGDLPAWLRSLHATASLGMLGNANLTFAGSQYVTFAWTHSSVSFDGSMSCATIRGTNLAQGVILIEPSYHGYANCECLAGYYGPVSIDSDKQGRKKCLVCLEAGVCLGRTSTMKIHQGFYAYIGNDGQYATTVMPREYSCQSSDMLCPVEILSLKETGGGDSQCLATRTGFMCGKCIPEYSQGFGSPACVPNSLCLSPATFVLLFSAGVLSHTAAIVFMGWLATQVTPNNVNYLLSMTKRQRRVHPQKEIPGLSVKALEGKPQSGTSELQALSCKHNPKSPEMDWNAQVGDHGSNRNLDDQSKQAAALPLRRLTTKSMPDSAEVIDEIAKNIVSTTPPINANQPRKASVVNRADCDSENMIAGGELGRRTAADGNIHSYQDFRPTSNDITLLIYYYQMFFFLDGSDVLRGRQETTDLLRSYTTAVLTTNLLPKAVSSTFCLVEGVTIQTELAIELVYSISPFLVISLLGGAHRLANKGKDVADNYQQWYNKCLSLAMNAPYASVIDKCLGLVSCLRILGTGRAVLLTDGSLECYQPWQFVVAAILVLLTLYPFALGLFLLRSRINKSSSEKDNGSCAYTELTSPYTAPYFCWELIYIIPLTCMAYSRAFLLDAHLKAMCYAVIITIMLLIRIATKAPYKTCASFNEDKVCSCLLCWVAIATIWQTFLAYPQLALHYAAMQYFRTVLYFLPLLYEVSKIIIFIFMGLRGSTRRRESSNLLPPGSPSKDSGGQ